MEITKRQSDWSEKRNASDQHVYGHLLMRLAEDSPQKWLIKTSKALINGTLLVSVAWADAARIVAVVS